ncbi:nucleotidyltransferase family protein [Psychroflexus aestuariivivens]|uniref:nucleotidyltransferase family protein n=1 Tax=Psychroflexus aestuariivivens TaxID=1795040 RepID=UPI000FD86CD3|nr:nucleotidyltransferase family protein [Psychroflexus aestuariivivens]
MNIDNLSIAQDKTLIEALGQLNRLLYVDTISRLILFVVDNNEAVVGTITDGDVRRALVKHKDLNLSVGDICNPNYIFEYETKDFLDLTTYRKKDIKILPMLNAKKQLVRIIDLDKIKAQLPLECMIMAGGRGKRLSPLTDSIPKPMLPLGDKPIIEHNIDRLISYGIQKIYISVKYLGEQIQDYFGDGSSKGITIEYIWEDEPLGTAGALSLVDNFETEHILLMNSDLFTNVDFEDMYVKLINEKADMAIASTEYKIDIPYAILEEEQGYIQSFKEKPSYIYHSNAGIYILSKELINKIPNNQFYDITDLMDEILAEGKNLIHSPIIGYWIDIGKPIDYKQAQEFIKHLE